MKPSGSVKKIKKQTAPDIAIAIEQLDKIAQSAYEEKAYDQFRKYESIRASPTTTTSSYFITV